MNANTNNANAKNTFYDSVLYARVQINEVKIIDPKKSKAQKYCAVNASILDTDNDGSKIYRTIDLIVRGDEAKKVLWSLRNRWPKDRFKREEDNIWIADINIGSVSHRAFKKKDRYPGATLKGRLINIRSLRINNEDILGKITDDSHKSVLVAPCYINKIDVANGIAKVSILDGKVGEHISQNVNLTFTDVDAFNKLDEQDLCPKGYKYRETNAKIFAVVEIEHFRTEAFKTEEDEIKSCLRGYLANVRYLKANDLIFISAKTSAAA